VPLYAETLSPRLAHGWGELRASIEDGHKYIHGPRPELFDLENDPYELRNLAPGEPAVAERMQRALARFIQTEAAQDQSTASIPDEETRQRLMALGYLSAAGGASLEIIERLRQDGAPPQDHVSEVNAISRGKLLLLDGKPLHAEETFRSLLERSPHSPMYNEMLASALLQLGKLEAAREALERIQGGDAGASKQLWSQLAFDYLAHRDLEAALEVSAAAAQRFPSAPVYFVRAAALRRAGDGPAAERALARALEIDPDHVEARIDLALRLVERGEIEDAASELEAALEINPYAPRAHYNYARLLLDLED
jgi:tetratricopeptide (TPR) repeat protein